MCLQNELKIVQKEILMFLQTKMLQFQRYFENIHCFKQDMEFDILLRKIRICLLMSRVKTTSLKMLLFLCKHILFILIYSLKEKQPNQFQKDNERKKIIIE